MVELVDHYQRIAAPIVVLYGGCVLTASLDRHLGVLTVRLLPGRDPANGQLGEMGAIRANPQAPTSSIGISSTPPTRRTISVRSSTP